MGLAHNCPSQLRGRPTIAPPNHAAGPQLPLPITRQVHNCPSQLRGRPTIAPPNYAAGPQLPGTIGKRSLSSPAATPHTIKRPEPMAAESYVGMPSRATELLRESPWYGAKPADLWQQFLEEMCSRDYEDCSEAPPATDIFAAFKGWVVGRYSVVLTRGEVLDALGEEWQVVGGKICDAELHYLVWKTPASRRRRRRTD